MSQKIQALLSILIVFCIIVPIQPTQAQSLSLRALYDGLNESTNIVRVRVRWHTAYQEQKFNDLGLKILEQGEQWALILANETQLETLARLRFELQGADDLGLLVKKGAEGSSFYAQVLEPTALKLMEMENTDKTQSNAEVAQIDLIQSLGLEQIAVISQLSSIDDDADGLTNTQEEWWCTDPQDPDTDSDGTPDGEEIQALKDWVGNRRSAPPGGTPWSSWPFNETTCPDKDHDSIPNLAERWELGTNMDWESSDRDKFDDGQEVFGVTYCPGGDLNCGYGDLPRSSDSGYVGTNMPAWVEAPGNHPFVTAFPIPEVDVVPSSLRVQTVTEVTTDHVISEGTEKSYSTSKTEGTSTSVSDTQTWNEWQEISVTTPNMNVNSLSENRSYKPCALPILGVVITGATVKAACDIAGYASDFFRNPNLSCGGAARWVVDKTIDGGKKVINGVKNLVGLTKSCNVGNEEDCQHGLHIKSFDPSQNYRSVETEDFYQIQKQTIETQDYNNASKGTLIERSEDINYYQPVYQMSAPIYKPVPSTTISHGSSNGGSHTTTHEQYEEHTITNGEAFSNEEAWGEATAVDSAHAADLRFTYKVGNQGDEYTRQICNLSFNVYIGADENPTTTYFVADDVGGDGCFNNFMPTEEHTYTSQAIALSLEQMRAIDLGGRLRVVVEDYSYGTDELFYQDAANAGILLAMEDGIDDGDETIDNYLIPTWGEETVLDVLARYFPHTLDENDNLISIWTPEQRADTPSWCLEPERYGNTLWCKHALSTADWWNIYTNDMGDGSQGFQDTTAVPGQTALFRFNKDSDLDGYSDRSEMCMGTDPEDVSDFPRPELLAGVHSMRNGDNMVSTLSLLNTGIYDAYGVEAVMIAPDDSISITNNTVGGSGRVKAQQQVIVGSHVSLKSPLPTAWTGAGHATPSASGYFTGTTNIDYSFTVSCANPGGCQVGEGDWNLNWSDGQGGSGSLNFGGTYASPTPLQVGAYGVQVALLSGEAANGENFTIEARTPLDTFQYTINSEPYTEPVVIVSYNDPQGNHRFIIPQEAMDLDTPSDDLIDFAGEMLPDVGVEMVTHSAASAGVNNLDLLLNLPISTTLTDSHLFLELIDSSGMVVSEVDQTVQVQAGPNVVPISFDTGDFDPAYDDPDEDYIVMAFWTDYEGNILDTAGRPLSSFQDDPQPGSDIMTSDDVWDFGTAQQGTLMQRQFSLASTGFMDLLTYLGEATGITVEGPTSAPIAPADTAVYTMTINTQYLPVGAFQEVIPLRTSDPANPERSITIQGEITPLPEDGTGDSLLRPLDWEQYFSGSHNAGEQYDFAHSLLPDPESLHPCKLLNESGSSILGVGKYCSEFDSEVMSYSIFGDGSEGNFSGGDPNTVRTSLSSQANSNQPTIIVSNSTGISNGDEVLIIQMQGTGAGNFEFGIISNKSGNSLTLRQNLTKTYRQDSISKTQVIRVPNYVNVTGNINTAEWNGSIGGVVTFRAFSINNATINVNGKGFKGGYGNGSWDNGTCGFKQAQQGGSASGAGGCSRSNNGGGGGAGSEGTGDPHFGSGGGGGYGTSGGNGSGPYYGYGGPAFGTSNLTTFFLGSGGGGGDWGTNPYGGGRNTIQGNDYAGQGSGSIIIAGRYINNLNSYANGNAGGNSSGSYGGYAGGGGSGGAIKIIGGTINLGTTQALGGSGGSGTKGHGGNAGSGRVRIEYCTSYNGSTNPSPSTQKINCFSAEQIEQEPFKTTRIYFPESFSNGKRYLFQYGRRFLFSSSSQKTTTFRLTRQIIENVSLDALISNTGVSSGALNLCLDFGNDGVCDFTRNATTSFPATIAASGFTNALNNYLLSRTDVSWGDPIDVPVRVSINRAAQVMLTNLKLTTSGNKTRLLKLPAKNYNSVTLDLKFLQPGVSSGPLSFSLDVGADNSIDCSFAGNVDFPTVVSCPQDLSGAVNSYLLGQSGEVNIPLRIIPSPFVDTYLEWASATPANKPDLTLSSGDISFSNPSPVESSQISIQATLHNNGSETNRPGVAAFFAEAPDWGDWYLGSKLIPAIASGGSETLSLNWDTLGFYGELPVKVILDPYDRLDESSESNNEASQQISILTRADLALSGLNEPEIDLVDTVAFDIPVLVDNLGQTDAGASTVALYDGNPQGGGVLIDETTLPIGAGTQTQVAFEWTPDDVGEHRLFAVADRDGVVDEANTGNNLIWSDVVVGLKSPVLIDSGKAGLDVAYDDQLGYGYLDEGMADVLTTCGVGTGVENTLRMDPGGSVRYKFDHLVPSHYYHLDMVLFECDGAGRQESVIVDGYTFAGPEDLGDSEVHKLSMLIDPALYVDRSLDIAVEATGINGAVVGAINLHDVDYRYVDAGNVSDVAYSAERGYGWLDAGSVANTNWGVMPSQSLRIDQSDDDLSYQFDNLRSDRNYKVHLTFWQKDGSPFLQKVFIDESDTNLMVNAGDYQTHYETVNVPLEIYQDDHSIVVTIQRLGANGAMVNEISLEEETLQESTHQTVTPTPYFSDVFGSILVNVTDSNEGDLAPVGTLVQAYDPRGVLVGAYTVDTNGTYGYMRVYGEDTTSSPQIPGLRDEELVSFKINGSPAVAKPSYYWQDDHQFHQVDLFAGEINQQAVLLEAGWNFVSFFYEPPSPVLANVLQSIYNRYDRVLSETGVFAPDLDETYITLRELHSGQSYYVRTTGTTTNNLLVDGIHQAPDTPLLLHEGWNWIGYMPSFPLLITEALASIEGKYQIVHSLLYAFNPNDPEHSTLGSMQPGEGYMIYMDEASALVYPEQASSSAGVKKPKTTRLLRLGVKPSPEFMTIYGTVMLNGSPAPTGTLVKVFADNDRLAGAAFVMQDGIIGYTHIFREILENSNADTSAAESLSFLVNGLPAQADQDLIWSNEEFMYEVNLVVEMEQYFLPLISR
jgi:hypothetical protein